MIMPTFASTRSSSDPFPHFRVSDIVPRGEADGALAWLRDEAPWTLRVEDFYEQHEFSLLATELGSAIAPFAGPDFIEAVGGEVRHRFAVEGRLEVVDVTAHRLTAGQTIRIHNDFLDGQETHRLLIQLNEGWDVDRGGLLMLFSGEGPGSVRHVIMPTHGSGFAFEISPSSYHAVSSIRSGERYTLVYTFRRVGDPSWA